MSKEYNPDIIIGLPTLQCCNLFNILQHKIMSHKIIEDICTSNNDIHPTNERINFLTIINKMSDYHPNLNEIRTMN